MEKRIFGATDGIRSKVGEAPLRPNVIKGLGKAISKYFNNDRILIGRDTRESGEWIEDEIVEGIKEVGGQIGDLGVLPTPAMQKIIGAREGIVGGMMLTASHNPATDNGLKVFLGDGDKLNDEQELEIEGLFFAEELEDDIDPPMVKFEPEDNSGAIREYVEMVDEALNIGDELDEMGIVLDAACGSGHDFSRGVFESFSITVSQIDPEPDGMNINEGFGALHPEVVAEEAKARGQIGLALDGDADRIILADEEGRIWDGDRIVILISEYLKENGILANDTAVLTEYSNIASVQYLMNDGIKVEKVINGDRVVAAKCAETGAIIGGENSGHIIYTPWMNSSDGTFIALFVLKIMREKGCRLADLWARYENAPSRQWGIKVREKKPLEEIPGYNEAVANAEKYFDGAGRVFCRYSGTENKLRILVEGENERLVEEAGERIKEIIEKEIGE